MDYTGLLIVNIGIRIAQIGMTLLSAEAKEELQNKIVELFQ